MSEEIKRIEYDIRKTLRDAGITTIYAQVGDGVETHSTIVIEHVVNDNQPILIKVTKAWLGEIREDFKTVAQNYFPGNIVTQLDREIGSFYLKVNEEEIKEHERKVVAAAAVDTANNKKQDQLQQEQQQQVETESTRNELGTWKQPISVKRAIHVEQNCIVTVKGQIAARGKIAVMMQGGWYECGRCGGRTWWQLPHPEGLDSESLPRARNDLMCIHCEAENERTPLTQNDKRNAYHLTLRQPVGINTVRVELMDVDTYDDIDTLAVMLFGDLTLDVVAGEEVIIKGKKHIMQSGRHSRFAYPGLYAHDVRYVNRETFEPDTKDIERVKRFVKLAIGEIDPKTKQPLGEDNVLNRLAYIYDPYTIGNELPKKVCVLVESSAGHGDYVGRGSKNKRRRRINAGLIGPPGQAKSQLTSKIQDHDKRNRYESGGPQSSSKTLTAIVTKEGEGGGGAPMLRIGIVPRCKEGVVGINEIGDKPLEDQSYLQDILEEGFFTLNKQGINAPIRSDTAVIWTSNPKQGADWSQTQKISMEEIPVRKQILDRTDFICVIRAEKQSDKRRELNRRRLENMQGAKSRDKILSNYDDYIKKHLAVVKRFYHKPTLSDEAAAVLGDAEVRITQGRLNEGIPNAGSNRILDTLVRTSEVIAALKLKSEVGVIDVNQAVEIYNQTNSEVQAPVDTPLDPVTETVEIIISILQNESGGTPRLFTDLANEACLRSKSVEYYLKGNRKAVGTTATNRKLRRVLETLENYSSKQIRLTQQSPAMFLWVGGEEVKEEYDNNTVGKIQYDVNDVYDTPKNDLQPQNEIACHDIQTNMSSHDDMAEPERAVQHNTPASHTSYTSRDEGKNRIEEEVEYKTLKACEMAMRDYKDDKAQGKESSALFTTQDVWYHIGTMFPGKRWNMDKVRNAIKEQIDKGRVMMRQGDPPDRYYLVWRDTGVKNNSEGEV